MPSFYEFFAGGGMVRQGLGPEWRCIFANDFDAKKGFAYQTNWGTSGELTVADIRNLAVHDLPADADMCWGSFPCQDLSLAGMGHGLNGERSGTFHTFWSLVSDLNDEGRGPRIVAVENVCGALTSRGGQDFDTICRAFADNGYRYGAMVINADMFVPQSRPRLFVIGVRADITIPEDMIAPAPVPGFFSPALKRAVAKLSPKALEHLIWWNMPMPARRPNDFADIVEDRPKSVEWHSADETRTLLAMMSPVNRAKVDAAKRAGRRMVGGVYRRTRKDENGQKVQRAEVRFDNVAGCLRTPSGGSSRQIILVVDGRRVRSRLLSTREAARLMGLPDSYHLPKNYNDAYHLMGDGVAAPVVSFLARQLFEPLLAPAQIADNDAETEKNPAPLSAGIKSIR